MFLVDGGDDLADYPDILRMHAIHDRRRETPLYFLSSRENWVQTLGIPLCRVVCAWLDYVDIYKCHDDARLHSHHLASEFHEKHGDGRPVWIAILFQLVVFHHFRRGIFHHDVSRYLGNLRAVLCIRFD